MKLDGAYAQYDLMALVRYKTWMALMCYKIGCTAFMVTKAL